MAVLFIVIPILVVLALIAVVATMRSRDAASATGRLSRETLSRDRGTVEISERELGDDVATGKEIERAAVLARRESGTVVKAQTSEIAEWVPPDPEQVGVARRQFLNRSIVGFMGLGLGGFGASVLAFLWPPFITGFGAEINAGPVSDLLTQIKDNNGFLYRPDGRMWLTAYPNGSIEKAQNSYSSGELSGMGAGVQLGLESGIVALFQKCPHLGCRVPQCLTSQWFECPCHGSQYNRVGEKRGGPAPRGMDRFEMVVSASGDLIVKTANIIQGPPIGTNTTGQEAEGPNCIGEASH